MYRIGVITASDKGAKGERIDLSGQVIKETVTSLGKVVAYEIVADEQKELEKMLIRMCDEDRCDLVLTTGGTGFAKRDVTPEATKAVINREVPGIAEVIRSQSYKITPRAMLSRGVAGLRGESLIINLPGSPKAVKESLEIILSSLEHGLAILKGSASECAR
ncbi:MAG: molybdopterin adenylyltransferase [Clostridia bacterium]